MPIRRIDFSDSGDKASHDRIVGFASALSALHSHMAAAKSAARREVIRRQIDATDAEIDRRVYDLYGLTAEEVALVEAATP